MYSNLQSEVMLTYAYPQQQAGSLFGAWPFHACAANDAGGYSLEVILATESLTTIDAQQAI